MSIGAGKVAVTETLRGYGSVLMVDHGGSYMSVYTNVRTVLVKQGQQVKQGQKIAEIGGTDGGRPASRRDPLPRQCGRPAPVPCRRGDRAGASGERHPPNWRYRGAREMRRLSPLV